MHYAYIYFRMEERGNERMVGSAAWIELDGIQRHEASSEGVSNAIHNTGFHPIIYIYIII
jgi:hypothetical protein